MAPPVRNAIIDLTRSATAEHRFVLRAQILLRAAKGQANAVIARRLGCHVDTVRKWRNRFAADPRVETLADDERTGRPAQVPVTVRCELIKLACDRPSKKAMRTVWTHQALADALHEQTGWRLSRTEVGRILRDNELQPHRLRLWLHSPDPDFRVKVRKVVDLYLHPPKDATVLCIDEKTSIQALQRLYMTKPARPGEQGRFEFEYKRQGTQVLIGAFNVATGHLFGQSRARRTAEDLVDFMEAVARQYPTGDVYVVWDNLNIHYDGKDARWTRFNQRHGNRFHFVYTPLHASWVNQIEIWFSILARRVLRYGDFGSVKALRGRILDFIKHWNRHEAHPFRWTFRGRFQQDRARAA